MTPRPPAGADQSTRRRILAATFVVLARDGRRKLQLSDVAAEAKVSRPTLYRHFGSKEGLLEAFGYRPGFPVADFPADALLEFVVQACRRRAF